MNRDEFVENVHDTFARFGHWLKQFTLRQLRNGRKLTLWLIFFFVVALAILAWSALGTGSAPTGCQGLQAIANSKCP